MPSRTYVQVMVTYDEQGQATPRQLTLRGITYLVDRLLERRQAAATKAGGQGMRYTLRIGSQQAYLFQDDQGRWFVEEKDNVCQLPRTT